MGWKIMRLEYCVDGEGQENGLSRVVVPTLIQPVARLDVGCVGTGSTRFLVGELTSSCRLLCV